MGKLEERIPDFARSGLAFRRKELDARRQSIEREAEERRRAAGPPKPSADQMDKDRQNYRKLLGLYPQYLDALEETYTMDQSNPIVQRRVKEARQKAIEGIDDVRRKLDTLEERTPDVATGTGAERARLESRWKELRDRDDRTSIPRDLKATEAQPTGMGDVDERGQTPRNRARRRNCRNRTPSKKSTSTTPKGKQRNLIPLRLRSARPSRGGSMGRSAAGEGDVSNLIERVESFEERLGVRLEGLFARNSDRYVEVNGELYARGGDELNQDIEVIVTVYDASGRVIAVDDHSFYADEFFGFEPFSILAHIRGNTAGEDTRPSPARVIRRVPEPPIRRADLFCRDSLRWASEMNLTWHGAIGIPRF